MKSLDKAEKDNKLLHEENEMLRERILTLEYQQQQCNLIFGGVTDANNESDVDCIHKLRNILSSIRGLDSRGFVVDKCYRLDGRFKSNTCRRVLCTFNWYHDVQKILRGRKNLPKGIFVNEDFSEEWADRCRILKPVFNAAKRSELLKHKTYMSKDKLVIDGTTYSVAPTANLLNANKVIDVLGTCQSG